MRSVRSVHERVRKKISGTPEMPRLSVYRSLNNIYVQVIDDVAGKTLGSSRLIRRSRASSPSWTRRARASSSARPLPQPALQAGIKKVVFDRGGYVYTGRVAEVAAGAREAGLDF